MIPVEFDIEENRSKETLIWIINLLIFIIGSAIWIPTGNPSNLIIFVLIWFILSFIILRYFPYRNLVGRIIFKDKGVEIINQTSSLIVEYDQIKELKLKYTLRRGLYYRHIDLGNNNIIEIVRKNDKLVYYLCVRNKDEEKLLKLLLIKLYEHEVNINETVLDKKTYGLEDLSYEEIQKFKSQYLKNKNKT